jgi:hypothetical protein
MKVVNEYELFMSIKADPSEGTFAGMESFNFWRKFFKSAGSPVTLFSYGTQPLVYPICLKDTYGVNNGINTSAQVKRPSYCPESTKVAKSALMVKIIFFGSFELVSKLEKELKKDTLILRWVVKNISNPIRY